MSAPRQGNPTLDVPELLPRIRATGIEAPEWAIQMEFGTPNRGGAFNVYFTPAAARQIAAALVAAADHYDAETARLERAA